MDLGQIGTVPLTLGAVVTGGAVIVGIVKGVIKGYRWFIDQITTVVSTALKAHEASEAKRFDQLDSRLESFKDDLADVRERLARIEGRLDE